MNQPHGLMPADLALAALSLPQLDAMATRLRWIKAARPAQLTPQGNWRIWLVMAGRGWGKTLTGAQDLAHFALWHPEARLAIIAPTLSDARDTCVEGESGLLRVLPERCVRRWNRSQGTLTLFNGARIKLFSADQPERLRGPQYHRVWCDELGAWAREGAFDQMLFGLRLGPRPQVVVTTTPRRMPLLEDLYQRVGQDVVLSHGRTADNPHLPAATLAALLSRYAGTRLGRQELDAAFPDDCSDRLWQVAMLEKLRVDAAPDLRRVVVAVDPALQYGPESDETGIIVAGLGADGLFYVLEDASGRWSPDSWAARAAALAAHWGADRLVVESNAGGALLPRLIAQHAPQLCCVPRYATLSKWQRALPIAGLYEQGRVRHRPGLSRLEEQMRQLTPTWLATHSPDRVDALVWALQTLWEDGHPVVPQIRSLV